MISFGMPTLIELNSLEESAALWPQQKERKGYCTVM